MMIMTILNEVAFKKFDTSYHTFQSKFINVYKPQRELSLDESILSWRGRLSFKVYNATNIIKYGFVIRKHCEGKPRYICEFKIYHGDGCRLQETVLLQLLEPFENL